MMKHDIPCWKKTRQRFWKPLNAVVQIGRKRYFSASKFCTNLPRETVIMTAGPAGIRPMSTRKKICAKFQFAFFSNLSVLEASKS